MAHFPPKVISFVVAVGLLRSHDPKSYNGGSFSFWQVLPSQAGQSVGSRQIDDRIAGSRARVVLTGRYNLCILAESYCCSGENTAIVGRCCVHQLSNQQPKEISEEIRPVSEWVSDFTMKFLVNIFWFFHYSGTLEVIFSVSKNSKYLNK